MVNYTKAALHSLISLVLGLILTFPIFYLVTNHRALFWFLLIFLWGTISSINGYLLKDKFDGLIFTIFLSGFLFIFLFLLLLIFNSFATVFLEVLNFSETSGINKTGTFIQSFLITLIIIVIMAVVLITFIILGTLIDTMVSNIKQEHSAINNETDFYKKYESPADAGRYRRKEADDFD